MPYDDYWDDYYYEDEPDDCDVRIRCMECLEKYYDNGDIAKCSECEEWICDICISLHECEE